MEKQYEKLIIEETEYFTELNEKFKNRKKWETPNPKKVFSYIPGQILEIFIKPGQKIEIGEELLILEAMKMRNRIVSDISGKIKSIYVEQNQNIPKNYLMIELE
jgi:biotin carboxyl carrier protein